MKSGLIYGHFNGNQLVHYIERNTVGKENVSDILKHQYKKPSTILSLQNVGETVDVLSYILGM